MLDIACESCRMSENQENVNEQKLTDLWKCDPVRYPIALQVAHISVVLSEQGTVTPNKQASSHSIVKCSPFGVDDHF